MSDFPIEIREINDNNIDGSDVDIDEIKPITKIEVSPNEEYLVIYNQESKSIVGWNIFDIDNKKHNTVDGIKNLDKICVSDDKKLVYIYNNKPRIIDMNNNTQEIKLYYDESIYKNHCTFNVKGEFIICNNVSNQKILRIYSTQTKNNKWKCKRIYEIPKDYELISISKYNKLYLLLRNCIYEWDIVTEKNIRIFVNEHEEVEKRDIRISSNKRFICLRIKYEKINDEFENEKFNDKKDLKDKIVVYSAELKIPIATLNMNDDISLYNIMKHIDLTLYPLLLALFDHNSEIWNSIMKYYWKVFLDRSKGNHHLSKEYQPKILPNNIQIATNYAFAILDNNILKIKFEENLSLDNYDKLSNGNDRIIMECWNMYLNSDEQDDAEKIKKTFKHLKILLFNPYKDTLRALFREVKNDVSTNTDRTESEDDNTFKWKIRINDAKILLQVYKRIDNSSEWGLTCTKIEKHNFKKGFLLGTRLINDYDIIILTTIGLFIYYFKKNKISLAYFYYVNLKMILSQDYENIFSKITLPLPSVNSFKLDGWTLSLANNKLSLLKYGVGLLTFAIKKRNLELIEDIYKSCMNYFKQDLKNNRIFLNIITSTMPFLKSRLPKYIERYSLETDLIIDSSFYSIKYQDRYTSPPQLVNSTNLIRSNLRKLLERYLSTPTSQCPRITFLVPYINFVNYPQDYIWWIDFLLPKPSLFVETMSKDIYKSFSGQELIRFKWHSYGFKYYFLILFGHVYLALYFFMNVTMVISNQSRNGTWISIILGFLYLFFAFRRFVYKMFRNPLKSLLFKNEHMFDILGILFDIILYGSTIYISLLWLRTSKTSDINDHIASYLSFSCLLLILKSVTFFRVAGFYTKYYIIVVKVAKELLLFFFYFVMVILLSFAIAFYILLSPKSSYSLDELTVNDDPNNPWNLIPTYQIFENKTLNSNFFIMKNPDENTNMFTSLYTSFFATCLLLTGDTSSFSNCHLKKIWHLQY